MRLSNKLLGQGYVRERLKSSLRKFYGQYRDLSKQYEVPLSRMYHIDCQNIHSNTYDQLHDSMISWHCLVCDNPNYSTCPYDLHSTSIPPNPFESLYHLSDINENDLKSPTNTFKPTHQSTPKQTKKLTSKCKTPLRVLNINFQSSKRKQHLIQNIIESTKPDIILGTET